MADMIITEVTIGGARLAIVNNQDRVNNASTLLVSYVPDGHIINYNASHLETLRLGGIPLSLSLCYAPNNPSAILGEGLYYAIDIIVNTNPEDEDYSLEIRNPSSRRLFY